MAAKAKKARSLDVAQAITDYRRARAIGHRYYDRADRLLDLIVQNVKVGEQIPLPRGKIAVLKDNFANANKVFRSHGIPRYELEVTEA